MTVFNDYARCYDFIYRDKDYRSESDYIDKLIQQFVPGAGSILELGCGSCGHAEHLAKKGYTICGVDISEKMLIRARNNIGKLKPEISSNISVSQADIRSVRLEKSFDAAISLFHVISYLPANDDLLSAFKTAQFHLKKNGVFIFDCWYGPAVLAQRPEPRVKRMEDDRIRFVRIAEPDLLPNENLVEVNYQILIVDKETGDIEDVREKHRMRYLFKPEVETLLASTGFELLDCLEFMTGRVPGTNTWSVVFIAKK
jgi:SAM-dependent methyltransferase